jgi:hypothetical protein
MWITPLPRIGSIGCERMLKAPHPIDPTGRAGWLSGIGFLLNALSEIRLRSLQA